MLGLDRERWETPLLTKVLAELAAGLAPGVPYLTSSPTGGPLPFQPDQGVSHYTGVGVFTRDLGDLRRAAPRFVSEGIALSMPPEASTVDRYCGGARRAGHDPSWKQAIHHDTGGSWDLEDVRDHYVQRFFEVDPALLRRTDPERALDLGRAAVAHVVGEAMTEWRRPGSPCSGFVLVGFRDLRMGAGGASSTQGPPEGQLVHLLPRGGSARSAAHRRGFERPRCAPGQRLRRTGRRRPHRRARGPRCTGSRPRAVGSRCPRVEEPSSRPTGCSAGPRPHLRLSFRPAQLRADHRDAFRS